MYFEVYLKRNNPSKTRQYFLHRTEVKHEETPMALEQAMGQRATGTTRTWENKAKSTPTFLR